ncbi:MAG: hypothetical protein WCH61_10945, partial [bacterium]
MTLRLLCLWVPFFLVGGAAGVDLRYGTYGRLAGPELPWRDGWCGAALIVEGADVVTVGALDVTTGGPYAHLQAEVLKILLHWTPLVDWRDQIPPRRWYSPYHLLLDRLGVPAGLRSRQSVLEAQIKAEEPVLEALGKQARATDTSTIPRLAPPPANVRQSGTPLTDEECQRRGGELVDLGNLHFYPWIYADSASRTGEPLGTHFRRQFQRLGSLSRWVADHCTSHQVWLTETGNLNPLSDEE